MPGVSVGSGSGVAAMAVVAGDGSGVAVRFGVGAGDAAWVGERKAVGDCVGLGTGEAAELAAGRAVAAAPQASNIPLSRNNNNRPVSCITRNSRRRRTAGCPLSEKWPLHLPQNPLIFFFIRKLSLLTKSKPLG